MELKETLFILLKGYSYHVNIAAYNSSEHTITLDSRSVSAHVEFVKSVTPTSVKLKNEPHFGGEETPLSNMKMKQNELTKVETVPLNVSTVNREFVTRFDLSSSSAEQKQCKQSPSRRV